MEKISGIEWQHAAYGHGITIKLCSKCKDFMNPNLAPRSFAEMRADFLEFTTCADCKIVRTIS